MLTELKDSPLFSGMTEAEIEDCLTYSGAKIVAYKKDDIIFHQKELPSKLMMLLDGVVVIGNNSSDGRRSVVATFNSTGELFGEVFVFLNKKSYDHYAQAAAASKILQIPRNFIYSETNQKTTWQSKIIANILSILAHKAYFLNQRLQVMSCATLRQKTAKVLLQNAAADGKVTLGMNREALADFLNVARPSLSRELMKMQEDGLLLIKKKTIYIKNIEELRNIL
ncbi:Crp/Fnr family transcriptional regulator [Pectinatus haikarae]|uniref:CRP-like cAMP-binding protein n=1 Tax=Pectinatus haikarae TaxID=349096 RepID=A0ABT9Y4B1_9FIRM|nr:Crp/Fnr family transcriptional regulator [Pectinatus haikarae]MDQ0202668.1 CRP-like cAMP-binding protein [Pectinatus haikarae]